ncbi:hypothetical protein NMG60_11034557 [Bertholletia excelsa]
MACTLETRVPASTSASDSAKWSRWSIYKIPSMISDLNEKAYVPQMVSFGPYHHRKKDLKAMEEHKQRALQHFLERTGESLESLCRYLAHEAQMLQDCYDSLDDSWQADAERFLKLMVVDGCFMLEILCFAKKIWETDSTKTVATEMELAYLHNDPVFSDHGILYVIPFIKRDMLILENQLPMHVLVKLFSVQQKIVCKKKTVKSLNKLILQFCNPKSVKDTDRDLGECLHVLDLYRKSLLSKPDANNVVQAQSQSQAQPPSKKIAQFCLDRCRQKRDTPAYKDITILRSATELHEAGVSFAKSRSLFLDEISFEGGVLKLPTFVVDDMTKSTFLNLIAFERCHAGAGHGITSYICFMDNIVEMGRDIRFLCSTEVLLNVTGSDEMAAALFNTMTKNLTMHPYGQLGHVQEEVAAYCKKRWNKWRAVLCHNYFKNPWAIVSFFAAILLFGLTIVQTVYSVLSYHN